MDNALALDKEWIETPSKIFWGEIAPCDHVVQIYENDEVFLDLLNGFVSGGVLAGDCVIVIATTEHLKSLNKRLALAGLNVDRLISDNLLIRLMPMKRFRNLW